MKALTLHQPWATLIALGAKQYETRSWGTDYRGPLAIHAGKNTEALEEMAAYYRRERELGEPLSETCRRLPANSSAALAYFFREIIREHPVTADLKRFTLGMLPRGAVVATAQLVAVLRRVYPLDSQEEAFGNFEPGRYFWQLEDVRYLDPPIPARGYQGLWDWNQDGAP
jgi:hypothetical protein